MSTCAKGQHRDPITIEGENDLLIEELATPQGTKIEVADLFFNTPVRSKYLKEFRLNFNIL